MIQERRSGPHRQERAAANTFATAEGSAPLPPWGTWREHLDWSRDVRLAYAAGAADGYALAQQQHAADADVVHRAAVKQAIRIIDLVDARERTAMSSYTGGPVPTWDGCYDLTAVREAARRAGAVAGDRAAVTSWREVHRDVTAEVWSSVWGSLCDRTRAGVADLDPYRLGVRR